MNSGMDAPSQTVTMHHGQRSACTIRCAVFKQLKAIQKRIKNALIRCDFPDYVFSGIKGRSYVENARKHSGKLYVYKIDISAFFPNTSRDKVYRFFLSELSTSPDVANILANLCTSDLSMDIKNKEEVYAFLHEKNITQLNHLCTGASPSPILSYLVNQSMFNDMKRLCDANGITMTIYVDDTIFSSQTEIPSSIRARILKIVNKHGYSVSLKKVKYYSSTEVKKITGVVIKSNGTLDIPNRLRYKIKSRFGQHQESKSEDTLNKLAGCVTAARQINSQAYPSIVEYIRNERRETKVLDF